MENLTNWLFYAVTPAVAVFLLIIMTIRLRRAKIKIAVLEIERMFRNRSTFCSICNEYERIPQKEFYAVGRSIVADYLNSEIKDYLDLNTLFDNIEQSWLGAKKKEAIIKMIALALQDGLSLEKLAKIYAGCRLQDIIDCSSNEKTKDFLSDVINNTINGRRNPGDEKEIFHDEVVKILETMIESTKSEDDKFLIRADLIQFKATFGG